MKFEHINGTLCLMTEPVPLTPEAKFPCVVHYVNDDSPMGMLNKMSHPFTTRIDVKILLNELPCDYMRYELIGYPVADGSAEWAAWRMMHRDMVINRMFPYFIRSDGKVACSPDRNEKSTCYDSIDDWLEDWKDDDSDGWRIYAEKKPEPEFNEKPKALLADAKVGDLCKHRNGGWSQIIDTSGTYIPGQPIRTTLKDTNGINRNFCLSGCHFTMQFGGEYDIIYTEPLAPEGSAEWAWFTSILDPKYDMVCGTFLGEHCVMWMHDCDCYIMPANWMPDTSRGKRETYDEFMRAAAPTGWQLYDPQRQSLIDLYMLDTPTRELVQSLLKAQEKGD